MYLSYRWLGRHLDLSGITPRELAEDLTLSTAEVEGLERFAPHLSDVTVGHVVERRQHPDADRLSLCTVDLGLEQKLRIVCGAPNVDAGQKVAVATVGTVLPGDLKIKKSKIRGEPSQGMICSVRELDLGDEHDGIWVLPPEAAVGRPVAEALGIEDWVIEIDNKSVTHRPDLWGHRGFAGELAAIYGRSLRPISESLPAVGSGTPFPVRIESPDCSRYLAIQIDGVASGPSPDWLKQLLLAVGQRPIDLLVDISNFVMLDLGQPNHLFDKGSLSPEGILVRKARAGETMKTLDGFERKLDVADLLICNGDAPVALAGVMGGEGSKVESETSSLLLEVASFDPASVRRTSARLGLRTDSSARFEKHLDPTLPMRAAAHMIALLKELQPELSLPAPLTDVGQWQDPACSIQLRCARVRQLLGIEIPDQEVADILIRLGFGVQAADGLLEVSVPSARATRDVTMEQDLVEEVGRIYRYGNVPERNLVVELERPPSDPRRALVRGLQDRLAGAAHFNETLSYSFLSDELARRVGVLDEPYVEVVNPVAEGLSRVRRSIAPSLLGLLAHNRRQAEELRLFEIGKGYRPEHADERGQPREVHLLALVLSAPELSEKAASKESFDAAPDMRLRAAIEDLVAHVERGPILWSQHPDQGRPSWANPGRAMAASFESEDGLQPLGVLAELEPGIAAELGLVGELSCRVAAAELSIDVLLGAGRRPRSYRPIPKYPGVKVDVALAVEAQLPAARVQAAIEASGKGLVSGLRLFDVYTGSSLGSGRKSLAYHVLLQSASRTLNDKDIHKFLERLERALGELGGELRRE